MCSNEDDHVCETAAWTTALGRSHTVTPGDYLLTDTERQPQANAEADTEPPEADTEPHEDSREPDAA